MSKQVKNFWPGEYASELRDTLTWMLLRMGGGSQGWLANALSTPLNVSEFVEGGIISKADLRTLAQTPIENIVFDPPAGVSLDTQTGQDGFPINYSPETLPTGNLFLGAYQHNSAVLGNTVNGRCLNLLQGVSAYRVDVWVGTDILYYMGSSLLTDTGNGTATWSATTSSGANGALIAFLMPASSTQPAVGASASALQGWYAHTNMGTGQKLTNFFARITAKTDIEYLKEDNVPIMVQDFQHARAGSHVHVITTGNLEIDVIFRDPFLGPVLVYTTVQNQDVFSDLPRSQEVPTSDPNFVRDPTKQQGAIQNRCWIYTAALAIYAYTIAGNFRLAQKIMTRLNSLLDAPQILPSLTLENAEDGLTTRWSASGVGDTITSLNDPLQPPYGTGLVLKFHAAAAGDSFTYIGGGLPDLTDTHISFQHREGNSTLFTFEVGVSTVLGKVVKFQITSDPVDLASYDSVGKIIKVPIDVGNNVYRTNQIALASLVSSLAADTLTSITSFKAILNVAGDVYFDNFSVGTLQPAGSLSFSYDVLFGVVDVPYLRAGAIGWVTMAYEFYMRFTGDYSSALHLQSMLNYLMTLVSPDADGRNGLLYLGNGKYQNPGYQYVPGLQKSASMEHNLDAWFAFSIGANTLRAAATKLFAARQITSAQQISLNTTANSIAAQAGTIKAQIFKMLYTAPSAAAWLANHAYALGDQVQSAAGNQFKCVVAGTSGAAVPAWPTGIGGTVVDNAVTWQFTGIAGDPGHFAEGIVSSPAGQIDTEFSVDSNSSWAALFAHAAGDDVKAVECLKFGYKRFFLQNKTIGKTAATVNFNEAYQLLTPVSGIQFDTSDPGAISQEQTWGMINALLRMHDNTDLQTFFTGTPDVSIDQFLGRLIQDQKTIRAVSGDGGMLDYTFAFRDLPWEFSIRPGFAATAWFWITATDPTALFPSDNDIGTPVLKPFMRVPQGVEQRVTELEGQSSIGALELDAIDPSGLVLGLASNGKLEGKRVALKVGYPGMAISDFVTVTTQQIDKVTMLPDYTGFKLTCRDFKRSAKTKIFLTGDDGRKISKDHPRTLRANPIDIALMIYQNELGIGQGTDTDPSNYLIYDPAQWSGGVNATLISPNPFLDIPTFLSFRNGDLAGYLLDFTLTEAVEAKQFIEYEICKVFGGWIQVNAQGQLTPVFFRPPYALTNLFFFNDRNCTALPEVDRQAITNQVTFSMDYDGSNFLIEMNFVDAASVQQFDLQGEQMIESKGLKASRGGATLATLTAFRTFERLGGADPVTGVARGGAPIYTVKSFLMTLALELGDFVSLSHPLMPNLETGLLGVSNRICQIVEKQPDYAAGQMTYKLLDLSWLTGKKLSKIALNGAVSAWTKATAIQKNTYAFLASSLTNQMSDGSAAKTIW